tara:strand:+ start:56 stop:346 length:291 start_codon:yes stop_codon:yes gene_type:complete
MKYARKCDVTGNGMNEGFCIKNGEMYIKYEKDLIKHLRDVEKKANLEYDKDISEGRLTDDFLLSDYYECGYYFWTEWECDDDIQYQEVNGVLTEID